MVLTSKSTESGHTTTLPMQPDRRLGPLDLLRVQSAPHIRIGGFDELPKSDGIDFTIGPEIHMAHEFAGAFEQAVGIGKLGAAEEADVDVSREGIDIPESRVTYTGRRMAI